MDSCLSLSLTVTASVVGARKVNTKSVPCALCDSNQMRNEIPLILNINLITRGAMIASSLITTLTSSMETV